MSGSRYLISARPTADGAFSITGVPAGTYLAVARDAVVDGQWENKEFLQSNRAEAARVTVLPGGVGTILLKVPPPR